jgi:hypothetical protein
MESYGEECALQLHWKKTLLAPYALYKERASVSK